MSKTIKKLLLLVPWIDAYVERVRQLQQNMTAREAELAQLRELIAQSRSPGLFSCADDFATERLMAHPVKNPVPALSITAHGPEDRESRVRVAKRLLEAYHRGLSDEAESPVQREGEDIWSGLIRAELSELIETLENRDAHRLAEFLKGFGNSYTWFGGISTSLDGYNRNQDPAQVALTYFDKLVCLAESIGALPIENPESGPWGDALAHDVDALVEKIEATLGVNVAPPMGIIHTDGIASKSGVLHYRHINALYMAARIANLNDKKGAVAEIGGGLGLTAMYTQRFFRGSYTIYDLPVTCMLAGHFLIHALGEDKVTLYGEPYDSQGIRLLPYWECFKAESKSVDITISQDGIPEMSSNLVLRYLEETRRITKHYFLSMNHENFLPATVDCYVKQSQGFERLYRFKSWTREGYVEECFRIK